MAAILVTWGCLFVQRYFAGILIWNAWQKIVWTHFWLKKHSPRNWKVKYWKISNVCLCYLWGFDKYSPCVSGLFDRGMNKIWPGKAPILRVDQSCIGSFPTTPLDEAIDRSKQCRIRQEENEFRDSFLRPNLFWMFFSVKDHGSTLDVLLSDQELCLTTILRKDHELVWCCQTLSRSRNIATGYSLITSSGGKVNGINSRCCWLGEGALQCMLCKYFCPYAMRVDRISHTEMAPLYLSRKKKKTT